MASSVSFFALNVTPNNVANNIVNITTKQNTTIAITGRRRHNLYNVMGKRRSAENSDFGNRRNGIKRLRAAPVVGSGGLVRGFISGDHWVMRVMPT